MEMSKTSMIICQRSFNKCLSKKFILIWTILATCMYFSLHLEVNTSDVNSFHQTDKCPACYGVSLCENFFFNQIKIEGWSRWKLVALFNQKNVFWAKLNNLKIVLKKLAHKNELEQLDAQLCRLAQAKNKNCDVGEAAVKLSTELHLNDSLHFITKDDRTDLIRCSTPRLIRKIKHKFTENFRSTDANAYIVTLMLVNPEPLIIQTFPSKEGWPFPKYLGSCGRVIVEKYVGAPLSAYQDAPWEQRLDFALQIAQIAKNLTNTSTGFNLYLTDVAMDNFAVSSTGRVVIVDAENIIVTDMEGASNNELYHTEPLYEHELTFSVDDLCLHKVADHNYYVICQGVFALEPWPGGMEGGLLHHLPDDIDHKWQLRQLIKECVNPSTRFDRFTVFPRLLKALENALALKNTH